MHGELKESMLCILHFGDPGSTGLPYPYGWSPSVLGMWLSLRLSDNFLGICYLEPIVNSLEIVHPYLQMLFMLNFSIPNRGGMRYVINFTECALRATAILLAGHSARGYSINAGDC